MRIGLDLMGGDYAPKAVLEGVIIALKTISPQNKLVLFGNQAKIQQAFPELYKQVADSSFIDWINAEQEIGMGESPTKSYAAKPNSSIALGMKKLAAEDIDVFIGSGNTGAMMVGAYYSIKPIEGVIRPTISSYIPQLNGKQSILLDVGVNPDVRQDVLHQFGILGSMYAEEMMNISMPRVALLNIGEEKEKGNLVSQAAFGIMESSSRINFVGNIEGYDLFSNKADVIVCDGFTGNVVLKLIEGYYKALKTENTSSPFLDKFNYENYGGTPVLGINKPVIIGHGISSPSAFMKMIILAEEFVNSKFTVRIKQLFRSLNDY
jgi:glycerol-3-phosphate acyltransferase PlsX